MKTMRVEHIKLYLQKKNKNNIHMYILKNKQLQKNCCSKSFKIAKIK